MQNCEPQPGKRWCAEWHAGPHPFLECHVQAGLHGSGVCLDTPNPKPMTLESCFDRTWP